jgi:hypothetical protein
MPGSGSSWQCPDFDAIKARYAVGLGPERDLAGARDSPVGRGEQLLAVKRNCEPLTFRPEAELVPLVRSDPGVRAFELLAPALDHAVEADVVLQRIGAHHIVVVGIAEPDGDAAGLIDLPGHRFESNRDIHVAGRHRSVDRERKSVIGRVRAGLLDREPDGRRCVGGHRPLPRAALAGARKFEVGGRRSGRHIVDGNHDGTCLGKAGRSCARDGAGEDSGGEDAFDRCEIGRLRCVHAQSPCCQSHFK